MVGRWWIIPNRILTRWKMILSMNKIAAEMTGMAAHPQRRLWLMVGARRIQINAPISVKAVRVFVRAMDI